MTGGSGVKKLVSQVQFFDIVAKMDQMSTDMQIMKEELIRRNKEANARISRLSDTAQRTDDQVVWLWNKIEEHVETITDLKEATTKVNMFFVDKFVRKKDVSYEDFSSQPTMLTPEKTNGSPNPEVPTIRMGGQIVLNVTPPNNEGSRPQVDQAPLRVNEPVVQVEAQPAAVRNVVNQPVNILSLMEQMIAFQSRNDDACSESHIPESIPRGYEDAATHISRFQGECGPYGNDPLLILRVFGSSLSGSALTWYTKLTPGSIPDWTTMERMFKTTFGTVEPEVDLSSLTSS
ncbi:hypothetical protein ACLB2K_029170 [Fragaria x ananassa]